MGKSTFLTRLMGLLLGVAIVVVMIVRILNDAGIL